MNAAIRPSKKRGLKKSNGGWLNIELAAFERFRGKKFALISIDRADDSATSFL